MNDTPREVETLYREKLMQRSGAERFRMGLEMFELATLMMLAGLPVEDRDRVRELLLRRLYGDEFTGEELQRILRRIRSSRA